MKRHLLSKFPYLIMMWSMLLAVPTLNGMPLIVDNVSKTEFQNVQVTGLVTDDTGAPLPGVTVRVKGTSNGTATGADGKFMLHNVSATDTIVFTAIGFVEQEKAVPANGILNVAMQADRTGLNEVVVVGYGTQKKKDLTGAIASVSSEEIRRKQPVSVFQALQGQAAGVKVVSNSGKPGDGFSIRIRGTSTFQGGVDPLYVVDGVPTDNIDDINPADIASIEILKDAASAAIYGSRSANGVVIVTTKKGIPGKPRVHVNYYRTYSQLTHRMPSGNAQDERDFMRYRDLVLGDTPGTNRDSLNPLNNADVDLLKIMYRTAVKNQLNMSVSGGSDKIKYYASGAYLNQEGILIGSKFNRLTSRINVDYRPVQKLRIRNNLSFSYGKRRGYTDYRVFGVSLYRPAIFPLYNPDGTYILRYHGQYNPLAWATQLHNFTYDYRAQINTSLEYDILKGLTFHTSITGDFRLRRHSYYQPLVLTNHGRPSETNGSDETNLDLNWINEDYLTYQHSFGKHNLTFLAGFSVQKWQSQDATISGSGYPSDLVTTLNGASLLDAGDTKSTESVHTLASFFGRISYDYEDKYLLNFNIRRDGSSRFGADKKWGTFPSVSAGWRFSTEPFMQWTKNILTDGKLRASWGMTGNERISNYASKQLYGLGYFYDGISGIAPTQFGNPNLSWESTMQQGIGLDLVFFEGRLNITADYYDKITSDLLYNVDLPTTTGFDDVLKNVGNIENEGFELSVGGDIISTKSFNWHSSVNLSFNHNHIKDLANHTSFQTGRSGLFLIDEGLPIGTFYGWKSLGIFPYDQSNAFTDDWKQLTPNFDKEGSLTGYTLNGKPYNGDVKQLTTNGVILGGGDVHWKDVNHDGNIDQKDRMIIGHGQPKYYGGFNNAFTYKGITLSILFDFTMGNDSYNMFENHYRSNFSGHWNDPNPLLVDAAWKKPGDITWFPMPARTKANNTREVSSLWVENGSYIKLRNIRLSYNLPDHLIGKIKLNGVSVFAQCNNVLTWTAYTGYDPEFGSSDPLRVGSDDGGYPRSREYGIGVNVNF